MTALHFVHWWTTERTGVALAGAALVGSIAPLWSARAARLERDRPMVAMDLRLGELGTHTILLVMRNYGLTIARDIRVRFEPELPDCDPLTSMTAYVKRRYQKPIPSLTPGQELVQVWADVLGADRSDLRLSDDVPMQVKAHVSFRGSRRKPYQEVFVLAADVFSETTWSEPSTSVRSKVKEIEKRLKGMESAMKVLGRAAAKWLRDQEPANP
jgi:hypothetical protein